MYMVVLRLCILVHSLLAELKQRVALPDDSRPLQARPS